MDALTHLRSKIALETRRLQEMIPSNRGDAILAILGLNPDPVSENATDIVFGRPLVAAGESMAFALLLDSGSDGGTQKIPGDEWATDFLDRCRCIVEAGQIAKHIGSGFMRSEITTDGIYVCIASKPIPTSWRERDDVTWWSHHSDSESWQFGYPPDTDLDGLKIRQWRDALTTIHRFLDGVQGPGLAVSRAELIEAIATDLIVGQELAARALRGFLIDPSNAAYHAEVPGIARAPLIDGGHGQVILSRQGLSQQPLLFLTRELRRRNGQDYHNASVHHETLFRDEVYALFADKRFVSSANRIQLRSQQGNLRTDIDAAVFDRKSGSLATFELKSQDPFARSEAELVRQRDNFLHANRQVSGMLDWLNRNSASELLNRVDSRVAKQFRVQNVYPFVVGRYLAHFTGGSPQDRRAAWSTWPQMLRELDRQPIAASGTNPLASLFARIRKGPDDFLDMELLDSRTILIGGSEIHVFPSFARMQKSIRSVTGVDRPAI